MTIQYMHISYEDWKELERQCKEFKETTHRSEGGFYHKSIRLKIGALIVEYHAPLVGGYGHQPLKKKRKAKGIVIKFKGRNLPTSMERTRRAR